MYLHTFHDMGMNKPTTTTILNHYISLTLFSPIYSTSNDWNKYDGEIFKGCAKYEWENEWYGEKSWETQDNNLSHFNPNINIMRVKETEVD